MIHMFLVFLLLALSPIFAENEIPISSTLMTDSPGQSIPTAIPSVFRIIRPKLNDGGTGFLHKSGKIITAAHVVNGSNASDVLIISFNGKKTNVREMFVDSELDVAMLVPESTISGPSFPIVSTGTIKLGSQVVTWGFPGGYNGTIPLLSVGYLSGVQIEKGTNGKTYQRLVLNAAFNCGNSGGPLIDVETKEVIGVVISKLAPIPPYIESALAAMKNNSGTGVVYTKTLPDGSKVNMIESQIIEEILQFLRSQTQLVIGFSANYLDLRAFLLSHGVDP